MAYKDRNKQREAVRKAVAKHRQGITSAGITQQGITIVDATGNQHEIDYDTRRKDFELMLAWAEGKGNDYQQRLGFLSLTYTAIKNIDINSYLGFQCSELIDRFTKTVNTQWPGLSHGQKECLFFGD